MSASVDIQKLNKRIEVGSAFIGDIEEGMKTRIVGQQNLVQALLIGLLSDGHILLEGVPGLAKTLAVNTLASLIDVDFSRIQFTPDLLPADILGTMIYSQRDEKFTTKKGPIFSNFVLADEINRAPAKVQSALLEAMQEHQVTLGDTTYSLPDPFLVLATQNPIEQEGTYPLPEAQVDRFMLKTVIDYPSFDEEREIVHRHLQNFSSSKVEPVVNVQTILEARKLVKEVYLDERIEKYVVDIIYATRRPSDYGMKDVAPLISFAASPRASIYLALAARTYAFLQHRGYVVPEDVRVMAFDVLRHRIGLSYEAEAVEMSVTDIINRILDEVEVP